MFKRVIEDFTCENCGIEIEGDGYTNHCHSCLWSKHVDNEPGDRAQGCEGLMEPVGIEYRSSASTIMHKCLKCGISKRNKSNVLDSEDALLAVFRK